MGHLIIIYQRGLKMNLITSFMINHSILFWLLVILSGIYLIGFIFFLFNSKSLDVAIKWPLYLLFMLFGNIQ